MKISYKKLQTYFEEKLPAPDALAEAFTFHAFEIEGIEQAGDDAVLDIKVLPDRACYAKSPEGIAREIKAILGISPKPGAFPAVSYGRAISVDPAAVNEVLGADIPTAEMAAILGRMDILVKERGGRLELSIPSDRLDIQDWRDIPEEVGRIYGYDKIASVLPKDAAFKPAVEKTFYYAEKAKNILASLGFSEVYTYSLVPKGDYEIEKPLAADKNHLRTNLSDGLVKALELNARNADLLGLEAIKIFEVGKAFPKEGESARLAFGAIQVKKAKGISGKTLADAARAALAAALGIDASKLGIKDSSVGASAICELNLDALVSALPTPASYADLGFGRAADISYKKFSQYPFMVRDIALFAPESAAPDAVWQAISAAIAAAGAAPLLVRHALFDAFKKDGRISYAFRMVFQSADRTLTDDEIARVMQAVYDAAKGQGWEVR